MLTKVLIVYYLLINLLLFLMYAWDKRAAVKDHRRIPEHTLLFISLLGGCVGGLIGMLVCHHKTRKPKFWFVNCCTFLLHILIICGIWTLFIK